MWRRGASRDGDAANFVETEQLLEVNGHLASYVQVCTKLFVSRLVKMRLFSEKDFLTG
jgi:hypothetical protein